MSKITHFHTLDPMGPSDRAMHRIGPAVSDAGRLLTENLTRDESQAVAGLTDTELLDRKHETDALIEELRIRLSVINIDLARRQRERADTDRETLLAADRNYQYQRRADRELADEIYQELKRRRPDRIKQIRELCKELAEGKR